MLGREREISKKTNRGKTEYMIRKDMTLTAKMKVFLTEVSLNIITRIISSLEFKTFGQIIPDQYCPTLEPHTNS